MHGFIYRGKHVIKVNLPERVAVDEVSTKTQV